MLPLQALGKDPIYHLLTEDPPVGAPEVGRKLVGSAPIGGRAALQVGAYTSARGAGWP